MSINCWEFVKCGREPGGRRVAELGVCPAAEFRAADGYLGGTNGGKACCFITGTFCEEILQGTYRDKSKDCWDCAFYRKLRQMHGAGFSMPAFAESLSKRDPAAYEAFIRDNAHEASDGS